MAIVSGVRGGTLRVMDTLNYGSETIIEYGIDLAFQQFADSLAIHNEIRNEFVMDVVAGTTKVARHRFGGTSRFSMVEVDTEFSQGRLAKKVGAGQTMGLPIKSFAPESVQWTERWLKFATVEELNAQFIAQQQADTINDQRELALSIFSPANYSFVDEMTDGTTLSVKRLANADSWDLPVLPGTGAAIDGSTHTHYVAAELLNDASFAALQTNVSEHFVGGSLMVYINVAQEAGVRALTDFVEVPDPRIQLGANTEALIGAGLDLWSTYNRRIGIVKGGAEVWVKPWVPAGYLFCFNAAAEKPVMRRQDMHDPVDLIVVQSEIPDNRRGKLQAWSVERTFGYGVVNRVNGACLKITGGGGGTTYTAPSI